MIRIFIGTSETEDRFIEQILVYSLYKHTSQPLDITFLRPSMFPDWNTKGWGTPLLVLDMQYLACVIIEEKQYTLT